MTLKAERESEMIRKNPPLIFFNIEDKPVKWHTVRNEKQICREEEIMNRSGIWTECGMQNAVLTSAGPELIPKLVFSPS